MQVLDALQAQDLLDNTLVVKTADHGDMGLSHGLRQKNFNFYEESLRVPLVHSNPQLFPNPRITDAMVSHVDFPPWPACSAPPPRPPGRASTTRARCSTRPPPCRTTWSSPSTTSSPASRTRLPLAAQPRGQHPRAALEARRVLRPAGPRAERVRDVRPRHRSHRDHEPRLLGATRARASRSANTCGCGASSRRSS
jgi:hypothetical protein